VSPGVFNSLSGADNFFASTSQLLFEINWRIQMTGSVKYFVSADGKKLGPFTGHQIRTKLFRKTITEDDYVWREGLGDHWVQIKTILDELPSDATPPPPPEVPQLHNIEIAHPDGSPSTFVTVPEKGVYEPDSDSEAEEPVNEARMQQS
jgi:hypothetical protein